VLTAIEDFMKEHDGDYYFWRVRRLHGMGIMRYHPRAISDRLSFAMLIGKALRYDSYALFNRVAKYLRFQRSVAADNPGSAANGS
jgi:hypothetical protein